MILRIERVNFEAYAMLASAAASDSGERGAVDQTPLRNIATICGFIAERFREDIDCDAIANSARIHPKYAMQSFKRSTGMTLSEYVNLMRPSYAQALLATDDRNVLTVAMDSERVLPQVGGGLALDPPPRDPCAGALPGAFLTPLPPVEEHPCSRVNKSASI